MDDLETILEQGKALEVQGKYADAEDILSRGIDDGATAMVRAEGEAFPHTALFLISLHNQRGIVRRMLQRYDDAFTDYQTALEVLGDCKKGLARHRQKDMFWLMSISEQEASTHINLADIYRVARKDFPAAHAALDEALSHAFHGTLTHARALDQRGLVFVGQKDHGCAIAAYSRANDICRYLVKSKPRDKDAENRLGQVLHHLGAAYVLANDQGKLGEAYDSQFTALGIFTHLGDQQGIVNSVATLGRIAMIKEDNDMAITQYERAWSILQSTGYGRAVTSLALHLAEAHLAKKEPEQAAPYLRRFSDGVLADEITTHDINALKDRFLRTKELYTSQGLRIERLEEVEAKFR